jgi:hypothetical protein
MRQIRIPRPKKTARATRAADLELDLRTPTGRVLPY